MVITLLLRLIPLALSFECHQAQLKIDLWSHRTCLRGANVWMKKIEPQYDGDSLGKGVIGPPYGFRDYQALAELGANYVNLSVPGIYTETPPYILDDQLLTALQEQLRYVQQANLFAVLSFRTGPGRNEAGFDSNESARANHRVWEDEKARRGWREMWEVAAQRFSQFPSLVGLDLMVEPNANDVFFQIWESEPFLKQFRNTGYDWNPMAADLLRAVRKVNTTIPVLVGGMNYSSLDWLTAIEIPEDPNVVVTAHQYGPYEYTHQSAQKGIRYPGKMKLDGGETIVDQSWLRSQFSVVSEFQNQQSKPVAINEFGVIRWAPGGEQFLRDEMRLFESLGVNHALWLWESPYHAVDWDEFNFRRGPDPSHHSDWMENPLLNVIREQWKHNTVRPLDLGPLP